MKRHHQKQIAFPPEYIKYPLETVWIEVDPNLGLDPGGFGYGIYGKDWDSGLPALTQENGGDLTLGGWNRGTYHKRRVGEYEWIVENWKMVYNKDRLFGSYIVDQPVLDATGIPMTESESAHKNGCFAFSGRGTGSYLKGLRVYDKKYWTDDIPQNMFGSTKISHFNVVSNIVVTDPNSISFVINNVPANTKYCISRDVATNNEFKIYKFWGSIENGNTQFIAVNDGGSNLSIYDGPISYPFSLLFVVSSDGSTFNDLPRIKIEPGTLPTQWVAERTDQVIPNWIVPHKEDFMQLFGMMGNNMTPLNFSNHMFVSPNDTELPWLSNWTNSSACKDILGIRLIPCGHKQNASLNVGGNPSGIIYNFGQRSALMTNDPATDPNGTDAVPTVWTTQIENVPNFDGRINWDGNNNIPSGFSIQYWQRNIRFCRKLTKEELGYEMHSSVINDRVYIYPLNATLPSITDLQEVPNGLLRGLAVRWMNEDKTEVLRSLSYLQSEIDKTENNGGYSWYGWTN